MDTCFGAVRLEVPEAVLEAASAPGLAGRWASRAASPLRPADGMESGRAPVDAAVEQVTAAKRAFAVAARNEDEGRVTHMALEYRGLPGNGTAVKPSAFHLDTKSRRAKHITGEFIQLAVHGVGWRGWVRRR